LDFHTPLDERKNMKQFSRRNFLKYGSVATAATMLSHTGMSLFASEKADTVRDRLWIWGHVEGVYDNAWGLPMNSRMTPLQAAGFLDTPNLIMVRYAGKPAPPFGEYAAQYSNLQKLMWSFVSAGGETSAEEQEHVLDLARKMPNITGLFMDDFFHGNAEPVPPSRCWLAENRVSFPVVLTLNCEKPVEADRLELQQTAWKTGDYRTSDVAIDLCEGDNWKEFGSLRLENSEGAKASLALPGKGVKSLRLRFLGTHDTDGAEASVSAVSGFSKAANPLTFPGQKSRLLPVIQAIRRKTY